jgi:hypothetical protein
MFSYASRRRLCEHAFQKTRTELYRRRHELGPILARHGIRLRLDALKERRSLVHHDVAGRAEKEDTLLAAGHRLGDSLDELERWLRRKTEAGRKAA